MKMKSLGIGIGTLASSKNITMIAFTLSLLVIPYIYVDKYVVKLETSTSTSRKYAPSSQVMWYTHANNLSSTKSTVQSVYHQYQRLDFLKENLVRGPHQCGYRKCVFPLRTDPRIGYLVEGSSDAEAMINAFTASKNIIEEKYGMDHIYLAPPKIMSVSLDFRKWMEMNMISYPGQKYFPEFTEQPEVLVQAVAIVPEEDSIMLGIKGPRRKNGLKGIEEMFTPKNNESWNITDVEITVKRDFALLYRLVEDEKDDKLPCLCADFQIFLLRSGHLIHLDVERCFEMSGLMGKRCVPKLQELETLVLNRLQRSHLEQVQQRMGAISNSSSSYPQQ
mmetsp:Transcript_4813/g.7032  ORF Transcript_4813/g.7032 Transcript_4813/m.7032 type:complete len:334 (-) Transcript_4813:1153-2154(-)